MDVRPHLDALVTATRSRAAVLHAAAQITAPNNRASRRGNMLAFRNAQWLEAKRDAVVVTLDPKPARYARPQKAGTTLDMAARTFSAQAGAVTLAYETSVIVRGAELRELTAFFAREAVRLDAWLEARAIFADPRA